MPWCESVPVAANCSSRLLLARPVGMFSTEESIIRNICSAYGKIVEVQQFHVLCPPDYGLCSVVSFTNLKSVESCYNYLRSGESYEVIEYVQAGRYLEMHFELKPDAESIRRFIENIPSSGKQHSIWGRVPDAAGTKSPQLDPVEFPALSGTKSRGVAVPKATWVPESVPDKVRSPSVQSQHSPVLSEIKENERIIHVPTKQQCHWGRLPDVAALKSQQLDAAEFPELSGTKFRAAAVRQMAAVSDNISDDVVSSSIQSDQTRDLSSSPKRSARITPDQLVYNVVESSCTNTLPGMAKYFPLMKRIRSAPSTFERTHPASHTESIHTEPEISVSCPQRAQPIARSQTPVQFQWVRKDVVSDRSQVPTNMIRSQAPANLIRRQVPANMIRSQVPDPINFSILSIQSEVHIRRAGILERIENAETHFEKIPLSCSPSRALLYPIQNGEHSSTYEDVYSYHGNCSAVEIFSGQNGRCVLILFDTTDEAISAEMCGLAMSAGFYVQDWFAVPYVSRMRSKSRGQTVDSSQIDLSVSFTDSGQSSVHSITTNHNELSPSRDYKHCLTFVTPETIEDIQKKIAALQRKMDILERLQKDHNEKTMSPKINRFSSQRHRPDQRDQNHWNNTGWHDTGWYQSCQVSPMSAESDQSRWSSRHGMEGKFSPFSSQSVVSRNHSIRAPSLLSLDRLNYMPGPGFADNFPARSLPSVDGDPEYRPCSTH
eukprot:477620_1